LIYWIGQLERPVRPEERLEPLTFEEALERYRDYADEILAGMFALYEVVKADQQPPDGDGAATGAEESSVSIFQVSLNRAAGPALDRSVPAVKADAAQSLFNVRCSNIVWAVLDSGIQNNHVAFMTAGKNPTSRVRKIFDFTNIREIVSSERNDVDKEILATLVKSTGLSKEAVDDHLKTIVKDFEDERPINWAVVEKLITVKPPAPDDKSEKLPSSHGTHVAGIIGADQFGMGKDGRYASGMCPDIGLYDFRVLGKTLEETEFAIVAALQYIRYVNERHNHIIIHGANLSLSIPHNVRNFACGRTPVCNECERLVESGVVVVAAAGNRGYQKFSTNDGPFENYAAFSITDPGNADGVITVGSTHGNWPHTYGVSFFSSRGPTGDGRAKPDLVAPGERILSTVPNDDWAPESGTSMAAPLVSGAAAMLLARYEELIGQPRRVKRILCESATDLGRERSFQGHGMLDVLRAFQSI
jgi:serine protease AprX